MIALTTRLNERDEAILQMQEELDAFDRIHRDSESMVNRFKKRVTKLERFLAENKFRIPDEEDEEEDEESEPRQRVKIGDTETFNVTTTNLLSPEEKIRELAQLADERKNQIDHLKVQLKTMGAENSIREDSRFSSLQQQQTLEDFGVIATSVNEIIQKLSQQNSPDVLKHVARKLLDLQRYTADVMTAR